MDWRPPAARALPVNLQVCFFGGSAEHGGACLPVDGWMDGACPLRNAPDSPLSILIATPAAINHRHLHSRLAPAFTAQSRVLLLRDMFTAPST